MPSECCECTAKLKLIEETVECKGGCGKSYCLKCSKIGRADLKVINGNININWFCNECTLSSTNMKFLEIKHIIQNSGQNKLKKSEVREVVDDIFTKKYQKFKRDIVDELSVVLDQQLQAKYEEMKKQIVEEVTKELSNNIAKISESHDHNSAKVNANNSKKKTTYAQAAKKCEQSSD